MHWQVPSSVDPNALATSLERDLGFAETAKTRIERTWVDSFDARLWRAGFTLALERQGRRGSWRLSPRHHGDTGPRARVARPADELEPDRGLGEPLLAQASRRELGRLLGGVGRSVGLAPPWWRHASSADERWARRLVHSRCWWARELPPGALREVVAPLIDLRALLPLLEVRSTEQRLAGPASGGTAPLVITMSRHRLRDGSARSVSLVEIELECADPAPGSRAAGAVDPHPRTGPSPTDREAVEQWLERAELERSAREPLRRWLARLGRTVDRPVGQRGPIDPTERADAAICRVLRQLCEVIVANIPGTVAALDSEFLHDLRVAIRRSRSVLGRMRHVLPERSRARFRRELRWLGQLSGTARDLDVYLLGLATASADLPPTVRPGLGPLRRRLEQRQAESHVRLGRALCSKRAARLLADWERFLTRGPAARPAASRAREPVAAVAAREIRRSWRQVMAQGRAIGTTSPPADLHELRKSCKKLRYLLELFGALLDADATRALVAPLKGLQRVLGDVQDLEVETSLLAELATTLDRRPRAGPEARSAAQALQDGLAARKQAARARFAAAFDAFAQPTTVALVSALLGHAKS